MADSDQLSSTTCTTVNPHGPIWIVDTTGAGDFTNISDAVNSACASNSNTILLTAGQTFSSSLDGGITITKNLIFDTTDTSLAMPTVDLKILIISLLSTPVLPLL